MPTACAVLAVPCGHTSFQRRLAGGRCPGQRDRQAAGQMGDARRGWGRPLLSPWGASPGREDLTFSSLGRDDGEADFWRDLGTDVLTRALTVEGATSVITVPVSSWTTAVASIGDGVLDP